MRELYSSLLTFIFLLCIYNVKAQKDSSEVTFNGQATSWGVMQFEKPSGSLLGLRFVPTLLGKFTLNNHSKVDFEASLNISGNIGFSDLKYDTVTGQFKPYRVWARYSGQNWEIRAGLQKINFGTAKMFRPLMWFDGMDIRDPLQLTDGVYGALARYYFQNNANIWFWTLIGNDKPKGFETMGTSTWKPEIGGRVQVPAGPGEIAISTNHRKINYLNLSSIGDFSEKFINESRIGLDGKWDLGIGLWFESSITFTEKSDMNLPVYQDAWNLGADYTIPLGNGLGTTVEYFRYHAGEKFFTEGNTVNIVGSMFTYPVTILDNISAMFFYVPGPDLLMNYLSWSRTYDNWNLYAIGFWNPTDFRIMSVQSQSKNLFSGKGIQLMVNYNF